MCVGNSMEPTLKDRDMLLVECISIKYGNFKKGDVIICKCPVNPDRYICKRVIGLAGDKVDGGIVVPVGHVWLQGDNTNNSLDSRLFGPVPLGLLRGRVFFKILPPNDIGLIATKNLALD
ncbi:hypothetical protein KM043_008518 [Ampulex compressa]|nr:hypothetical protein KM043_008518 [Ampulex compressa]